MTADVNNETYIAGALLIDGGTVIQAIQGIVSRDDFYVDAYGAIFTAALSLAADKAAIDPVSIRHRALREGVDLSNELIMELMDCTPTTANCVEYAHRVAEDARTRRIKELAMRLQDDDVSSSDELLAILQRETEAIQGSNFQRGLLNPAEVLRRFNAHVVEAGEGRSNFISSGFVRLNQILGGGFIRGGLYILGARPAVGKSTFSINLADNIQGNTNLTRCPSYVQICISAQPLRLTRDTRSTFLC